MTKKELINQIKQEIKVTSEILKANKNSFKFNQRLHSKAKVTETYGVHGACYKIELGDDYKKFVIYPFQKIHYPKDQEHYKSDMFYDWGINPDSETAKCHLTCLHIMYNRLRNKKPHCHSKEREDYYVKWNKTFFERMEMQQSLLESNKEPTDANSCS